MSANTTFPLRAPQGEAAAVLLESGGLLRWSAPAFPLLPAEQALISTRRIGGRGGKNISFDAKTGLRHAEGMPEDLALLQSLLQRFGAFCQAALATLLPEYLPGAVRMRASFRPAEIEGRCYGWRSNDRLRHVDAFPSQPTGGNRILRMFCNADTTRPRVWRTGPDFESYIEALLPHAPIRRVPGLAAFNALTGITKTRRTLYDAQMLALHDAAKRDSQWQETAPVEEIIFHPGDFWMVFTDLVPHAVLSGRNALEQTFIIGHECLLLPERSPLAILNRRRNRDLRKPA